MMLNDLSLQSVLVACPINEVKSYALDNYFRQCLNLSYPNKEFYFVDNSGNEKWHLDNVVAKGWDCDYVAPKGRRNCEYLCESQNKIRERFLEGNFDYLFSLECDIGVPLNIIEQMIAYNEPIVSCNYFINHKDKAHLLKTEIEAPVFGNMTNRNIDQMQGFIEHGRPQQQSNSSFFGFGCCLMHRSIVERFPFNVLPDDPSHSDTIFYFELYEAGIKTKLHDVIVKHNNSSWEDVKDFLIKQ